MLKFAIMLLIPVIAFAGDTTPTNAKPVTFTKDIAPIFQKSCQTCHHAGTSAPMSLVTYNEARPWSKSIKERVATRDMPPWHLDKTVGIRHYKNDRSLSDAEIATVVRWVDSGAPQGDPADMPAPLTFTSDNAWYIGKPDLLVTTDQDFKMYPAGPDWWIDQYAEVKIPEDRWIKSMEIKPSNPKIVHHCVVYVIEPDAPEGTPEGGVQLHEYAVGKYGDIFSENTGRLLKAGTRLRFDMHYFAIGSEQHNKTTIAFKFYPKGEVPKYQVRSIAVRNLPNDELEIPPNSIVRTDGYYRLTRNARIDSFQPHMHMRGKGMTLEAINLNNTVEILSSVDHFNFNWHINYIYADDVAPLLPAGTVLHMIGIHDNTSANRHNPDPNMWVGFGERSVDDMVQVWLDLVYLDDADFNRMVAERRPRNNVGQGNPGGGFSIRLFGCNRKLRDWKSRAGWNSPHITCPDRRWSGRSAPLSLCSPWLPRNCLHIAQSLAHLRRFLAIRCDAQVSVEASRPRRRNRAANQNHAQHVHPLRVDVLRIEYHRLPAAAFFGNIETLAIADSRPRCSKTRPDSCTDPGASRDQWCRRTPATSYRETPSGIATHTDSRNANPLQSLASTHNALHRCAKGVPAHGPVPPTPSRIWDKSPPRDEIHSPRRRASSCAPPQCLFRMPCGHPWAPARWWRSSSVPLPRPWVAGQ